MYYLNFECTFFPFSVQVRQSAPGPPDEGQGRARPFAGRGPQGDAGAEGVRLGGALLPPAGGGQGEGGAVPGEERLRVVGNGAVDIAVSRAGHAGEGGKMFCKKNADFFIDERISNFLKLLLLLLWHFFVDKGFSLLL